MALGEQYMSHLKLIEALSSKLVGLRQLSEGLAARITSTQRFVKQAFVIPTVATTRPQVGVDLAGIRPFEVALTQPSTQAYFSQKMAPLRGLGEDVSQPYLLEKSSLLTDKLAKKVALTQPSTQAYFSQKIAPLKGLGEDVSQPYLLEKSSLLTDKLAKKVALTQPSTQAYFSQKMAPLKGLGADVSQPYLLEKSDLLTGKPTKKGEKNTQSKPVDSIVPVGRSSIERSIKGNYSNYVSSLFSKKGQFAELISALEQPNKETSQEKYTDVKEFFTSGHDFFNTRLSALQKVFKSSAEAVAGQNMLYSTQKMPDLTRALQLGVQLALSPWGGIASLLTTSAIKLLDRMFNGRDEAIAAFKQSMNDLTHTFRSIVQPLSNFVETARSWLTTVWNKLRDKISTTRNGMFGKKNKNAKEDTPSKKNVVISGSEPSSAVSGGVAVSSSGLQGSEEEAVQKNIKATVTSGRRNNVVNVNIGTAVNIENLINQTGEGLEEISNKVVEVVIQAINEGVYRERIVVGGI